VVQLLFVVVGGHTEVNDSFVLTGSHTVGLAATAVEVSVWVGAVSAVFPRLSYTHTNV